MKRIDITALNHDLRARGREILNLKESLRGAEKQIEQLTIRSELLEHEIAVLRKVNAAYKEVFAKYIKYDVALKKELKAMHSSFEEVA